VLRKWIAAGAPWPAGLRLIAKNKEDYLGRSRFVPTGKKKIIEVKVFP